MEYPLPLRLKIGAFESLRIHLGMAWIKAPSGFKTDLLREVVFAEGIACGRSKYPGSDYNIMPVRQAHYNHKYSDDPKTSRKDSMNVCMYRINMMNYPTPPGCLIG